MSEIDGEMVEAVQRAAALAITTYTEYDKIQWSFDTAAFLDSLKAAGWEPAHYQRLVDLHKWQDEACEELADIRGQWMGDYLWWKHNERPVCDLFRRAGVDPVPPEMTERP